MALPASNKRADGVDGHALTANDLAHILRMQTQFVNRRAFPFDRGDGHAIGMLHETLDDVFEKGLHTPTP